MTRAEAVLAATARAFGVHGPDVTNVSSHSKTLVNARNVAAWILRTHADMSFPEIARAIGYADHTTAMDAYRRACRKIDADPHFTRCLRAAESALVASGT